MKDFAYHPWRTSFVRTNIDKLVFAHLPRALFALNLESLTTSLSFDSQIAAVKKKLLNMRIAYGYAIPARVALFKGYWTGKHSQIWVGVSRQVGPIWVQVAYRRNEFQGSNYKPQLGLFGLWFSWSSTVGPGGRLRLRSRIVTVYFIKIHYKSLKSLNISDFLISECSEPSEITEHKVSPDSTVLTPPNRCHPD